MGAAKGGDAGGAGSGEVDSWHLAREREIIPVAGDDGASRDRVSRWAMAGLGGTARARVLCGYESQQFVCVSADDCPRSASGRGNDCAALGGERFPAAQAGGGSPDRG